MTLGPYREAAAGSREGPEGTRATERLVVLAASGVGWVSVAWTARLILSAPMALDAVWLGACAAFGASLAGLASGSRRAAAVSVVGGVAGGALFGSVALSSALYAKGLPPAAGFRFALQNGGPVGAACGLLLGASGALVVRAMQRDPLLAVGRTSSANLALTWLGGVGAAAAVAAFATGVRSCLPGAMLALSACAVGWMGLFARDSKRLQFGGDEHATKRSVAGSAWRAAAAGALLVLSAVAFVARPPLARLARARWIDEAFEAVDSSRIRVGHMVRIPGGTFVMGSPADPPPDHGEVWGLRTDWDEFPAHPVTVDSFELDDTEVTVAAYRQCVEAGGCSTDGLTAEFAGPTPYLRYCNWSDESRANHPINCVSWYQADAYCRWAGKRLPTEAEWEYAARGGSGQPGHWHDTAVPCECESPRAPERTCPVARFPSSASPDLVLDLAGDVWEWTSSAHCLYPSHTCDDRDRVARGGGWTCSGWPRLSSRFGAAPERRDEELGFRCAR